MELASGQDEVKAAISEIEQALPSLAASPHVSELQVDLRVDSNGRDAAFIMVILDDDPSGNLYAWSQLKPIHDLIWNAFTARELTRWPNIEFRLKSELGDSSDESDKTSA